MRIKSAKRAIFAAQITIGAALFATDSPAYVHMVTQGETLAQIATRVYGDPKLETVIAGASSLDAHGGSTIVPGMNIEILAPGFHRVDAGETWADVAGRFLGDKRRAEVLARANGGVSWVQPEQGQEILIPAVVSHIAAEGETMPEISQRYLNDQNRGWEIDAYNYRKSGARVYRGEIVLVPLMDLALTRAGREEARASQERGEGGGEAHEAQKKAESEIPPLLADVRGGRYVDVVVRGNRLLGSGELTRAELANVHRSLLEAYVALDAVGAAAGACEAWRANVDAKTDATKLLDPRTVSPKIRAACGSK